MAECVHNTVHHHLLQCHATQDAPYITCHCLGINKQIIEKGKPGAGEVPLVSDLQIVGRHEEDSGPSSRMSCAFRIKLDQS